MRAINPGGFVRLGVFGSLSPTNSPSAPNVNNPTAIADPMKDNAVPSKLIHLKCAAQATAAGAVIERNPQVTPMRNDNSNTSEELTPDLLSKSRSVSNC
jgi:hypothetical protein